MGQMNERLAGRAAQLWAKNLADPQYDNGDNSLAGAITRSLAEKIPANNTAELLAAFEVELKRRLLAADFDQYMSLGVDYNPDPILAESAEAVGLNMKFPWKTRMYIMDDHLQFSEGYGGREVCHFPISEGRWLVTDLRPQRHGQDMAALIKWIEAGNAHPLTVEAA